MEPRKRTALAGGEQFLSSDPAADCIERHGIGTELDEQIEPDADLYSLVCDQ